MNEWAAVCQCCALLIANGDESGCRDYYGHDHPSFQLPGLWAIMRETGDDSQEYCDGCGAFQYDGDERWVAERVT